MAKESVHDFISIIIPHAAHREQQNRNTCTRSVHSDLEESLAFIKRRSRTQSLLSGCRARVYPAPPTVLSRSDGRGGGRRITCYPSVARTSARSTNGDVIVSRKRRRTSVSFSVWAAARDPQQLRILGHLCFSRLRPHPS